jgi:hypothetical protein
MSYRNYPHNWHKVSKKLRDLTGRCELCGVEYEPKKLSVHHKGAPYPDGRPGDPRDKHDLRLCNLSVICLWCHDALDGTLHIGKTKAKQRQRRRERLARHRALGVGTGLVLYQEVRA